MSLSATDTGTAGVAMIRYTTDGSEPTAASPLYTGPFTVSATTTVKYRAWDNANNLEADEVAHDPDRHNPADAPRSPATARPAPAVRTRSPVSVTLSATDGSGGSGVASIHYTLDGSDPTLSSPTYSAPFTVSATTTVKYRAWDNAGNVEPTNSQLITITAPIRRRPRSSIACNGSACSGSAYTLAGERDAVRDGRLRRIGRRLDPLHARRLRSHALEPHLQRSLHRLGDDDGQVPRLGQRGQRRAHQLAADHDHRPRYHAAHLLDRLQRLGLLRQCVHARR